MIKIIIIVNYNIINKIYIISIFFKLFKNLSYIYLLFMEIIDTPEKVYENVSNIIESSNIKLDYKIVDHTYIDEILDFVNKNYNDKDGDTTLVYSRELMEYYLIDSIPIFFYGKKNPNKLIGLIIGKYYNIMSFDKKIEALDGNFMCVIPQLRKLKLPQLIIAYLVREGIKRNTLDIKIGYYTTGRELSAKSFCKKKFIHRCINYDALINLGILPETKYSPIQKKLYSKFNYPEHFKQFKIVRKIEDNQIEVITDKINSYQKQHFDIYEYISTNNIKNINNTDAFIKFVITNNTNEIEAFISFYKLDILNKNKNELVRTYYLHYYFSKENIVDYLEYIAEYLNVNNMCDMFLTHLFEENIPQRYFQGNGSLYYNVWNVKDFKIKENKLRLCVI